MRIPLQVGSELRIHRDGTVTVDNPEIELANQLNAVDAVLLYRFDPETNDHIIGLLEPAADHKNMRTHERDD